MKGCRVLGFKVVGFRVRAGTNGGRVWAIILPTSGVKVPPSSLRGRCYGCGRRRCARPLEAFSGTVLGFPVTLAPTVQWLTSSPHTGVIATKLKVIEIIDYREGSWNVRGELKGPHRNPSRLVGISARILGKSPTGP